MEPRQHKQRLCSNGGVTAADKLRAPRVVRSLKIFLDSWWSLKREEVTSGHKTQSYRNKRKLCEKERRLIFSVFLGIAVMTVVVDLCVMVWIVFSACLFNLLYYVIWRLHPSKKLPLLNWKKIRLTSYVTFRLDCKRIVGNFGWDSAVSHRRKFSWGSNELSSCENKTITSQYTQFIKTKRRRIWNIEGQPHRDEFLQT